MSGERKTKTKSTFKLPKVSNQTENFGVYNFRVETCNVSIANAIRRTLITDIPTVCFNVGNYNELTDDLKTIQIFNNTTSFNNEILKQRLACIPVHLKNVDPEALDNLVIEVNESNKSDVMQYITTEKFKIIDSTSNKELSKTKRDEIFPKSELTKDYILFARLKPSVSKNIPGQSLHFRSKLFISDAKNNGQFNSCSTSAYAYTEDEREQQNKWLSKENELSKLNYPEDKIAE